MRDALGGVGSDQDTSAGLQQRDGRAMLVHATRRIAHECGGDRRGVDTGACGKRLRSFARVHPCVSGDMFLRGLVQSAPDGGRSDASL